MAPKPRGQSGLFMISLLDLASRQPLEGRVQQYRFSSYYHSSREKQGKDNPLGHYILRCRCDQILYQYDVDMGATNPNRQGRIVGNNRQKDSQDMPRLQAYVPRLVQRKILQRRLPDGGQSSQSSGAQTEEQKGRGSQGRSHLTTARRTGTR